MTKLLELREKIRTFYYNYDRILRSAGKFILAFCVFFLIMVQIGADKMISILLWPFVLALVCAFLPANAIAYIMCGLIVVCLWKISPEVGAVAVILFLIMFLMYFIYKPRRSVLLALTAFSCMFHMGGMIPISVGLLYQPIELIPMCLGIFVYNMLEIAQNNYTVLNQHNEKLTGIEKITYYIDNLFRNDKMLVMMLAFVLTVSVVYLIRKRPYSYAWSIAIPSGVAIYVLVMMMGNVLLDVAIITPALVISCVLGVVIAFISTAFSFVLDGTRTEYLEYEDDEYYYYVKAIPKVTMTVADKKVTKITEKQEPEEDDTDFTEDVFESETDLR